MIAQIKLFFVGLKIIGLTLFLLIKLKLNPENMIQLKHTWALSILKYLNYNLEIINSNPLKSVTDQAVLYVGNHISFLDIIVLMCAEPRIVFLSKYEVKNWPLIGYGARTVGTLFVKRESTKDRAKALTTTAELLKTSKAHLAVFPSGTTTLDENLRWRKGLFTVAQNNNIPVVLFKLKYEPERASAYIDEDSLIGQLLEQVKCSHKTCTLTWLGEHYISDAEPDAEKLRQLVIATK